MSAKFLKELILMTLVSGGATLLIVLLAIIVTVNLVFGFPHWIVDREQMINSPSGFKYARITSEHYEPYLGGAPNRERVWIGRNGKPKVPDIVAYAAEDGGATDIVWTGDNRLQITLTGIQAVSKSLAEVNGVRVVYHLGDQVLKSHFRQYLYDVLHDEAGRTESRFVSDEDQKRQAQWAEMEREREEMIWNNFLAFNTWALANADNAEH